MIVTKGVFTGGELPPVHRCSQIPLRGFVVKNQEAFLTDFFFTSSFRITKLRDLILDTRVLKHNANPFDFLPDAARRGAQDSPRAAVSPASHHPPSLTSLCTWLQRAGKNCAAFRSS